MGAGPGSRRRFSHGCTGAAKGWVAGRVVQFRRSGEVAWYREESPLVGLLVGVVGRVGDGARAYQYMW